MGSLSSRQYIICNTSKLNVQSNRFYIDFVPWIKSTNRSVDNGDSFSHQKAFFFQIHFTIRWRWCGMEWAPFQLVCCVRWRSSCLPIIIWKIWFWVWRNLWNRVTILQLSFRCRFMQKKIVRNYWWFLKGLTPINPWTIKDFTLELGERDSLNT